jgi:hypothetical protein
MNSRVSLVVLLPIALSAQIANDPIPLKNWPAPLYWHPSGAESRAVVAREAHPEAVGKTASAASQVNLTFVAMTPCRVVDTRAGQGFSGSFGPPSLAGQATRTFPIYSSTTCSIPGIAQAYSFNVTVVPPGFLGFITVYPTGQPRPNASTMNDLTGLVLANAAVVAAGTSGAVDVFANNNTDLIIDINGYYTPASDHLNNTALGLNALSNNVSGITNTAVGSFSLYSSTNDGNTAVGYNAGVHINTGTENIMMGDNAGTQLTTGS